MPWRGAEYDGEFPSLGWEIIDHIEDHLRVPAGPLYGQPMRLTANQQSFFVRLYRVDERGHFVYRRASRRGPKGKGKSPEGAMFVIEEFCGPVIFDGWDADGEPVGKPRHFPWVQIAACSEEQDHNLYGPMREMLAESDLIDDARIELGKTKVQFSDGKPGMIEPVSSSAGAREGQPITAAALEETHLWLPGKGGPKLARVLRRNAGKTAGRTCEFTNAPALGEASVAEDTERAALQGQRGLLYDTTEGVLVEDPKNPENKQALMDSMRLAYDDSLIERGGWVDLERQYEETQDADVPESDVFRFYCNLSRKAENRAFDAKQFDALKEPREPEGPCLLMFDGARTRDCAVFTAWTIDAVPYHFHHDSWVRPPNPTAGYEHPRGEIRAAAREFVRDHDVALFAYDSSFHELSSLYDEWEDEWGSLDPAKGTGLMVAYPTATGKRMEPAILRMVEDTREALYRHDGHKLVTEHVHNAVLTKNRTGYWTLGKEKDSAKIDASVTMTFGYDLIAMAREAVANRAANVDVFFAVT